MNKKTRIGKVTNNLEDSGAFPSIQTDSLGGPDDYIQANPYGVSSHPPLNNYGVIIPFGCDGDAKKNEMFFPISGDNRIKGLAVGEFVCGNWVAKSYIYFKEGGDIEIISANNLTVNTTGSVDITASSTTITSDVTIDGNLTVTGSINGNSITSTTSVNAASVTATGALGGATLALGGTPLTATHTHNETGTVTSGPNAGT